jgi:V/A-type H+-transporting ATPase subunit D
MNKLGKDLKIRENALPTLQAKESALRIEVKKAREELYQIDLAYEKVVENSKEIAPLWNECPSRPMEIQKIIRTERKIAGVKILETQRVEFQLTEWSLFSSPHWLSRGLTVMKDLILLRLQKSDLQKKVKQLDYARRKTTQKVNLYEKVQIPEFRGAILKIKRFMEDEENLAISSQKILKNRMAKQEAIQ